MADLDADLEGGHPPPPYFGQKKKSQKEEKLAGQANPLPP